MSRRNALRLVLLGAGSFATLASLGLRLPAMALATEGGIISIPISQAPTVGKLLALTEPTYWVSLPVSIQNVLLTAPTNGVRTENEVSTCGLDVGGNAWLQADGGSGSSTYAGGYTTTVNCAGLSCRVTYSKDLVIRYAKDYFGSGLSVSGSATVSSIGTGTFSAVITGYPTEVPKGYDVSYSQAYTTVYIY